MSLHYRGAQIEDAVIKKRFDEIAHPYQVGGQIAIIAGKKVFEIRPVKEGRKGKIVADLFLRERLSNKDKNILPIYIGDDQTDEDAFKEINDKEGITIRVGKDENSFAYYYVNDTNEVAKFLEMILSLKKG
jgi:trehalose 6-phosphate phosphatase